MTSVMCAHEARPLFQAANGLTCLSPPLLKYGPTAAKASLVARFYPSELSRVPRIRCPTLAHRHESLRSVSEAVVPTSETSHEEQTLAPRCTITSMGPTRPGSPSPANTSLIRRPRPAKAVDDSTPARDGRPYAIDPSCVQEGWRYRSHTPPIGENTFPPSQRVGMDRGPQRRAGARPSRWHE
jgi:hypothetical protein